MQSNIAYIAKMDIETLQLFIEVMRAQSFTEVAASRRVAPSSVSRAINRLETELGVRLFQRNSRNLRPTEAGRLYYQRVSPMVEELHAAAQMAVDATSEPQGKLRITAPTVYGNHYITPLLAKLNERYPTLSVDLFLTDSYVDLIGERIDVAIRLGTLADSDYVARKLHTMGFHVCASPEYLAQKGTPKKPADLSQHECVLFPRTGGMDNWHFSHSTKKPLDVPVSGKFLITNSDSVRHCLLQGLGIGLLPDWLVGEDIKQGRLVSLFDDYHVNATQNDSAIWVLQPSRQYSPLKVKLFVDLLFETIQH